MEDAEKTDRNATPVCVVQRRTDTRFVKSYSKWARIVRYRTEVWNIH